MNEVDRDSQFIFEEFTTNINFLDINLKAIKINSILMFTTNLQILLIFTIKAIIIALSLVRRIVRIVTDNKNN